MDKKFQYIFLAIAIILLIVASYFAFTSKYQETQYDFDSISLLAPASSTYTVSHDNIEFKNSDNIYNLNITKTDSTDSSVKKLLKAYINFNGGTIDYLNESCYIVYVKFKDRGFEHHSMIIPVNNIDKDSMTFKNNSTVWIFDANNREFVLDSTYNSRVIL